MWPWEFGPSDMEYCGAKEESRDWIVEVGVLGRKRERTEGSVRTCWTFLEPERCRRTVGHFIAAERSRWWRAAQEVGVVYSVGA